MPQSISDHRFLCGAGQYSADGARDQKAWRNNDHHHNNENGWLPHRESLSAAEKNAQCAITLHSRTYEIIYTKSVLVHMVYSLCEYKNKKQKLSKEESSQPSFQLRVGRFRGLELQKRVRIFAAATDFSSLPKSTFGADFLSLFAQPP